MRPEVLNTPLAVPPPALGRSFWMLLIGQFVSFAGTMLSFVALPWFVLSTTGSPGKMTSVVLAEVLPQALLGIPAGALVDRWNRKRMMVALDLLRGLFTSIIPILALFNCLPFSVILLVAFANGLLTTPYLGARMALVPALVGDDEVALVRANTALQITVQGTNIFGPWLAVLVLAAVREVDALLLDALSYLLASLLVGVGVAYLAFRNRCSRRSGGLLSLEWLRWSVYRRMVDMLADLPFVACSAGNVSKSLAGQWHKGAIVFESGSALRTPGAQAAERCFTPTVR